MVKKKYIVAIIILAIVVIASSVFNYNRNYTSNISESMDLLKDLSDSVKSQYDATFFEICIAVEKAIEDTSNGSISDEKKVEILNKYVSTSYFVEDLAILYDDGKYLSSLGIVNTDIEKASTFFSGDESLLCAGMLESISDESLMYAVNRIVDDSGEKYLFLVGLNYNNLNMITRPENYHAQHSYVYLVTGDGYFLYHPDNKVIGKNIINDKELIQQRTGIDDIDYDKLLQLLNKTPSKVRSKSLEYKSNGEEMQAYANRLEAFNGVVVLTSNFSKIKDELFKETLRTILPLIGCLIIGIIVFLRYLFLIKYTDYFTEVKNDRAFRKYMIKTENDNEDEKYLILKIENIIDSEDRDFLYDDSIFYKISSYFKGLKHEYKELYRISRVHYIFRIKDIQSMFDLIRRIKGNVGSGEESIILRGKIMCLNIDKSKETFSTMDIDNKIVHSMDDYYTELINYRDLKVTNYSDILSSFKDDTMKKNYVENLISNKEIVPYFQPIVDTSSREIFMHEVLLRVKTQDKRYTTQEIIEIAEKEALVQKIDRLIIAQAFGEYNRRQYSYGKRTKLSINISGKSVDGKLKDYIIENAEKYYIEPEDITFELTETAALEGDKNAIVYLNILREKGFKLAIDDFGTGYSHISLLSKIHPDYIKIDGVFVQDVWQEEKRMKTLNALVYLCKNYNSKIIAEHVEDAKVLAILKKMEVEYAQGYYYSRAVPEIRSTL
ncbi:MAG: EAL domain-containing protein [Firmicutes bacterium]|jgi:EAL domain-containing protein (putative c-di-GMP-specific phosphodiesterase class I)|nr:EAL domain-containing protein [Bacillota bacterium]